MAIGRKTGGRQAGSLNKVTAQHKELLSIVVEDELKRLPEMMQDLTNFERLQVLTKLLPYILPKADNGCPDAGGFEIRVVREDKAGNKLPMADNVPDEILQDDSRVITVIYEDE